MMSHEPHRKGGQEQVTNKINGDTVGGGGEGGGGEGGAVLREHREARPEDL